MFKNRWLFTVRKQTISALTNNSSRRKINVDWMLESIHSHRVPSMCGIHYLLVVCMPTFYISVNMFKNIIDNYPVRAGCTKNS